MKALLLCLLALLLLGTTQHAADARPNILWLTSEDNGPHLGAYGDPDADTPHLDRFAARSIIHRHAWSNAPVCAPARTAIISGLYPTSTGSQHMRSRTRLPEGMVMFPRLLREAGYYTTNNSKEDYNLEKTGKVWDDSSRNAHWRHRPVGAPFFAVFNSTVTHESRIRQRPHEPIHDPATVRVPAYHPDAPEVRQDWAQYHDQMTVMDAWIGERLAELEADGLADDTIVFYFGDHGPGMPRCKRSPYDSGLRVPMIVHLPTRFRHLAPEGYEQGTVSERLVSFVDLGPTTLSLAGIAPPPYMQGRAFLGVHAAAPRTYVHGFRDRMDERYDLVRSACDGRYVYLRNFLPHRIPGQHVAYLFQTPTTQVWRRRFDAGSLPPHQARFFLPKPAEELYDLSTDPDEVVNLAASPEHAAVLARFRTEVHRHLLETRDLGFLSEEDMHRRAGDDAPFTMGRDDARYPLAEILAVAERATDLGRDAGPALVAALAHRDGAVRTWGAIGCLARGKEAVAVAVPALRRALHDPQPSARLAAAEALARYGEDGDLAPALAVLLAGASLDGNELGTVLLALTALDELDARAAPIADGIRALPATRADLPARFANYVPRLLEHLLEDLPAPRNE